MAETPPETQTEVKSFSLEELSEHKQEMLALMRGWAEAVNFMSDSGKNGLALRKEEEVRRYMIIIDYDFETIEFSGAKKSGSTITSTTRVYQKFREVKNVEIEENTGRVSFNNKEGESFTVYSGHSIVITSDQDHTFEYNL